WEPYSVVAKIVTVVDGSCYFVNSPSKFKSQSLRKKAMANLDERIRLLGLNASHDDDEADTFAQRAESYYRQRPQLLSLLQELYNAYHSLADRHCQSHSKHHHFHHFPDHSIHHNNDDHDPSGTQDDSDAESAISFQPHSSFGFVNNLEETSAIYCYHDMEDIVAELVTKNVVCNLMVHELSMRERRSMEISRKVELQKSLLEVLESERLILLNENSRLVYRVGALVEENKGLASESMFMKRKAGELARCVLKMREDHRVCLLSKKIEDLQRQIFVLEKRNEDYYEQLVKRDKRILFCESCRGIGKGSSERKKKSVVGRSRGNSGGSDGDAGGGVGGRLLKWLEQVKGFNIFLCGPRCEAVES
ncbi:hypothetical protein Ancab_012643, partial [Ancistrocladus abbreviatus]